MTLLSAVLVGVLAQAGEGTRAVEAARAEERPPGKVSPEHDRLDALAGRFRFDRVNYGTPGQPGDRATGVSDNRWVLDAHYLESRLREGETAAESAVITLGYDLRRRIYFALVVGSRGTNYRNLEGFWDAPARSLVLLGKDPGDGRTPGPKIRQVLRIESRDRHVMELYVIHAGRLPQKVSEITFVRE